ncbi:MAG: phosphoesterase [Balneolaceae bacterium]|nr:phosphoesterase [Balneolaceae bacterium]
MKRKSFLRKTILGTVGVGLMGGIYSWQIEPFWVQFMHHKMSIQHLPEKLEGKTLMQISDLHIGNRFDYQYIIDSFKKAGTLNPDIVVYTGDYVTFENDEQYQQLNEVLHHAVKGRLGTVAILGNHDYGKNWSDKYVANQISRQLEESGITVLRNAQVEIEGLNITGLDDLWGLNFNPDHVMNEIDPTQANLMLCHNPDVCDLDIWNDYKGWVLAGHTHGGQFKPPFLPPPLLPVQNKKYTAGIIDLGDGRTLYINRAIGHLLQIRFNMRPEITVFKLAGYTNG